MASFLPLLLLATGSAAALNFTIAGGQIFTPGLAVLDAPQPGTPLGGELIEVALDVSANGRMPLPPYADDSPSKIYNITIFLSSYDTGRNLTITNATASANNASLGDIMLQEPGSTVKHVKWKWPSCLVGNGQPTTADSPRGVYNVSIRQNFRLNGVDHYTIFDLPISVTNEIGDDASRPPCDDLSNPLIPADEIDLNDTIAVGPLFAPGDSTVVEAIGSGFDGDGLGSTKPEAGINGLGSGASTVLSGSGARLACVVAIVVAML